MMRIEPPIIIDENGSIEFYRDIESAADHLEAIDVLNAEYEFFDSVGHVLRGIVEGDRVVIVAADPEQLAPKVLENRLRRLVGEVRLGRVGSARMSIDRPLEEMRLTDLVEALRDFFGLRNDP